MEMMKNTMMENDRILDHFPSNYAKKTGLEVHAGHGLTYKSAFKISKIRNISEFNIGHFIIGESIFNGFKHTIKKFKRIIR